ncbi:MAG: chemotaxis protein CheW [Deltaproteobacteria bacterium]|nr:chemotaxis protein CheW [Deltaproteobacteria bacterium]
MTEELTDARSSLPAALGDSVPEDATIRDVLSFTLADEIYALPLGSIHEILKTPPITHVPRAPEDVLGIISVRGRITTVLDLRRRLHLEHEPSSARARILLVDSGVELLGLLVDEVHQVHRLTPAEVELSSMVSGELADYVLGIGRPGVGRAAETGASAELLILLDPESLLKRMS